MRLNKEKKPLRKQNNERGKRKRTFGKGVERRIERK